MNIDAIYNQDCMVGMKEIPDRSIDLILCDLPYGVTQNKADVVIPFADLWVQYNRVIKVNGAILLFAQGQFFIDLVNSNRKMYRYDLVWDKMLTTGFLNAKRMPLRQHEQIAVFYKKMPTYNPQFEQGKPLHGKGSGVHKSKNSNYGKYKESGDHRKGSTQKYPTSILRFSKPHPSVSVHPTQKPLELLIWLIKTYSNEGDVVLDNCCGSGSTCVAAKLNNRHFIGFETDENYYKMALRNVQDAGQKQITMFEGEGE